jgi:hypothetical protein
MTEYEEKFLNNGQSIYGIKAFKWQINIIYFISFYLRDIM